jgi:hypothetical protein
MKKPLMIPSLLLAGVLAAGYGGAHAQGATRGGFVRKNPTGGVTSGFASGVRGTNSGASRVRGFATAGQGNAVGGSAGTFKTPGGAVGARGGFTTRSADGHVHHQGGGVVSGVNGTASTSGFFDKNADGTVSGSRTTTVQNKNSEASYQGSTTYNPTDGFEHTGTCTSTSGDVVACK